MTPNRTEILVHERRRRDTLAQVARDRLVDAASRRSPAFAAPGTFAATGTVPGVARLLWAAVASRLAVARRWAHVG